MDHLVDIQGSVSLISSLHALQFKLLQPFPVGEVAKAPGFSGEGPEWTFISLEVTFLGYWSPKERTVVKVGKYQLSPGSSYELRLSCSEGPEDPPSFSIALGDGCLPLWFVIKVSINKDSKVLHVVSLHNNLFKVLRE